jgi:hypothetical protein
MRQEVEIERASPALAYELGKWSCSSAAGTTLDERPTERDIVPARSLQQRLDGLSLTDHAQSIGRKVTT